MEADGIESLSVPALSGVRHAFFTRKGGVSTGVYAGLNCGFGSGDAREAVAANRARAAAHLGVAPGRLVTVHQVHGRAVATVMEPWAPTDAPQADGLVTDRPGLALGVLAADCAPVLFADAEARVVGAAHAGWKGALAGITDATVAAMEALGARRARIVAQVGPCIAQSSYEVGPELRQAFLDAAPENADFFAQGARTDRWQFDLPGYVVGRLAAARIGAAGALGRDTYADAARFYSFRRTTHRGEGDYGRLLSAIALPT